MAIFFLGYSAVAAVFYYVIVHRAPVMNEMEPMALGTTTGQHPQIVELFPQKIDQRAA